MIEHRSQTHQRLGCDSWLRLIGEQGTVRLVEHPARDRKTGAAGDPDHDLFAGSPSPSAEYGHILREERVVPVVNSCRGRLMSSVVID